MINCQMKVFRQNCSKGPEKEEKKIGYEKIFEEIITENFPNMEKEIVKSKRHKESHTG